MTPRERLEALRALDAAEQASNPRAKLEALRALDAEQGAASGETRIDALKAGGILGLSGMADNAYSGARTLYQMLNLPAATANAMLGGANPAAQHMAQTQALPARPVASATGAIEQARDPSNQPYFTAGEYGAPGLVAAPFAAIAGAGGYLPKLGAELLSTLGGTGGAVAGEQVGGNVGKLIGGLLGSVASPAAFETGRRLFRGGDPGRVDQAIDDFAAVGATPTAAEAGGALPGRILNQATAPLPGVNMATGARNETMATKVQNAALGVAKRLARNADEESAGITVERGLTGAGGFVDRFKSQAGRLYKAVDDLIPPQVPVSAQRTEQVLGELSAKNADVQEVLDALRPDKLGRITEGFQAAQARGITYSGLKAMRTEVGRKLTGPGLVDDVTKADYKRLYAALSEDMLDTAKGVSTKAQRAAERANTFYRAGLTRIEERIEPLVRNRTPEKVFNALVNTSKDGPTILRSIRRSLKPEEWDVVSSVVLKRLGEAKPGLQNAAGDAFDVSTFLTNWNRIAPGAKRQLFNTATRRDLDTIARVAEDMRKVQHTIPNWSGTTDRAVNTVGAAATAVGVYGGYVPLVASVLGGAAGFQLLNHSPAFVRWLARSTRIPVSSLPAHLNQLDKVAREDPGARKAIQTFINAMGGTQ